MPASGWSGLSILETQVVIEYSASWQVRRLTKGDVLDGGGDVIPGFRNATGDAPSFARGFVKRRRDHSFMSLSTANIERIANWPSWLQLLTRSSTVGSSSPIYLEHFETLKQVDTSTVPPTASVLPLRTVIREDAVHPEPAN